MRRPVEVTVVRRTAMADDSHTLRELLRVADVPSMKSVKAPRLREFPADRVADLEAAAELDGRRLTTAYGLGMVLPRG